MTTRPLTIITTRLPPQTCGIGTHSWWLRQNWPNERRPVCFLVMEDGPATDSARNRDAVTAFAGDGSRLAAELDRIGDADVLLHYAARAYHRFGCPIWMPRVLASWRKRFPGARLMIFFHELPGKLPITSRHYWLGKIDAHIIQRLTRLAHVVVTNTEHHAATLRSISGRTDIHLAPVGSNIESVDVAQPKRVPTEFALFGLPFGRLQTLRSFHSDIRQWIESEHLTKLHIIGPADDRFTAEADAFISAWADDSIIEHHGVLPSSEVSLLLQQAQFAITNVSSATWSKSGAFMAAAANRCAIIMRERPAEALPLCYTVAPGEVARITTDELERRTGALATWYRENADWPVVACRLASLLDAQEMNR